MTLNERAEKMELEVIEWVDSYGCSPSWQTLEQINNERPLVCYSVGWVAAESEQYVTVIPHRTSDAHEQCEPQGCGDMTIPKCSITKRKVLKE